MAELFDPAAPLAPLVNGIAYQFIRREEQRGAKTCDVRLSVGQTLPRLGDVGLQSLALQRQTGWLYEFIIK